MTKLLVIGATGRTGRLVVASALRRGHEVTVLVRQPGNLTPNAGLRVRVGDPLDPVELVPLVNWADVVVSTLRHETGSGREAVTEGAAAALQAGVDEGAARYIVVSQALLFPSKNPLILLLRWLLRASLSDSRAMEKGLRESRAQYTIIRAPRLKEGGERRGYTSTQGARPQGGMSMERIDLADALVDFAEQITPTTGIVGII